ncbi:chromosome segregation protein SMC [bacterium]|nr:chromosome segregation protein SMC [bacterium]
MFFKKLELQGFKSFAHRTPIDFQEGFTIVVGPNGCGKSNVLDAIRWVLGETSAKSLRGGRMSDVVFRGSQSVKRAGLAQVTLTLDNTDGHLKIDQSEVAVTRRLFSNGDSEYQINKVTCRMRDIHELFLDTGLGADGYSIIEQGQIGQMVAAKPDERRDIFEEAAGISRYKVRRAETQRKLKRTEDDLVRVQDLVSEVERQCNSLRYQARKAQRHRRLSRRLHRLQQRLLVLRYNKQTAELGESNKKLEVARAEFEEAAAKAAKGDARSTELQQELENFQRELQALQQKRFDVRSRLDKQRHRAELCGQQIKTIDERIEAIDKELESRKSRATVLSGTIDALQTDLEAEEKKLAASDADLREKVQRLEAMRAENEETVRETNRLRAELSDLRARENTLANDKRVAETLIARLEDELGATEFQLKELNDAIEKLDEQLELHRKQDEELKLKLAELQKEGREIQEQIGRDDATKADLNRRLESLTRELNQATSRLQALRELEDSYEGYYRGVREVMLASGRKEIQGIVGVVSSLVGAPKDLEIAIEVTLGSDVQDIVTERVDDAKQAIAFLKRKNLGRATFLPLDFLHADFPTNHLQKIWGRNGVLGLARDLVNYDDKISRAVHYLFGNTVIVEHLDIAVDLERDGIRNRFVSLQGDVVNPRGVLSGGSHQTRGLLTRQREIRQLQEKVKTLESDLKRLHDEMEATKSRLGGFYARAAEIQSEVHRLQMEEASVAKDLQQVERERRDKRNQQASVEARTTQQRLDRVRQGEIIENAETGLVELAGKVKELEEALSGREERTSEMLAKLQTMGEDVAVSREAANSMSARVDSFRQRLEETRSSLEESKSDQQARNIERETLLSDRQNAILEREEAENLIGELSREFEAIDNEVGDRTSESETRGAALRQHVSEVQRLVRDRNERDNAFREVELHCAELRAQIEYIEAEAEDEFGQKIEDIIVELREAEEEDRRLREEQEKRKEEEKARKREERRLARLAKKAAEESGEDGEDSDEDEEDELPDWAKPEDEDEDDDSEDEQETEELGPATTEEDDQITDPAELRRLVTDLRGKLSRMGAVNEAAIEEYSTQSERLGFLTTQRDDLVEATRQLEEAIAKIDETTSNLFTTALDAIRANFQNMFQKLFNGGKADLILVEDERYPEPGIDIYAQPPGKHIGGSITLMSGGEKALTAIALMFSLFQFHPSPICILDEIDAPLDDVNVSRMCQVVKEYARTTQFLIISHNKITMSLADTIYGVTMQEPGVSKVVSVKFDEVEEQGLLDEQQPSPA